MKILITGGTGSLGRELISQLKSHEVIVYSRDELKQAELSNDIVKIIGDIRDFDHLNYSLSIHQPDYIIHTSALKRVDDMELYPMEAIKTNILGSQNLINACIYNKIKKCILISTDKCCQSINVYGSTKFIAERLFVNANKNCKTTKFAACRYGNVMASRGSFIPSWYNKIQNEEVINITDINCTRFLFSLSEAGQFVLECLFSMIGGEIFVPRLKSFYITQVITALERIVKKKAITKVTGLRLGEKIHESMLNEHELIYTFECPVFNRLVIVPQSHCIGHYTHKYDGPPLNSMLHVSQDLDFLTDKIRNLI